MTRLVYLLFFCLFVTKNYCQVSTSCNCNAIINPDSHKAIPIYNKPNGRIFSTLRNNFKKENFLVLTIKKETDSFFYAHISGAMDSIPIKGWLKKTNLAGVYGAGYSLNHTINLYNAPGKRSKIHQVIPGFLDELCIIKSCHKNWLYIKVKYKGKLFQGWLSPVNQCANPYTTCN